MSVRCKAQSWFFVGFVGFVVFVVGFFGVLKISFCLVLGAELKVQWSAPPSLLSRRGGPKVVKGPVEVLNPSGCE